MIDKQEIIFGIRPVLEAINSGKEIDKIMIRKGLTGELSHELMSLLKPSGIPYQFVPVEKLNRITRKNHQGVIAFISLIPYSPIEEIIQGTFERGESPFILLLDGITDVRNFGAIARSAEVAGVHAIVIPEKGGAQINSDAIKTSAGALLSLPVCRSSNLEKTAIDLRVSGLRIIGTSEKAEKLFYQTSMEGPIVLVMGSEDTGISSGLLRICDELVKIPQHGRIKSLNVSAAAAVMIFEAVKQRHQAG
jgi:23S rRNA (guanosine2251-2'-O)-methyltransferase